MFATGCFYTDPINDRPQISAVQRMCPTPSSSIAAPLPCDAEFDNVHRGDAVQVRAMAHDPDGSDSRLVFRWQLFACGDEATCDASPAYAVEAVTPMTPIPRLLASTASPVRLVHFVVVTTDERGAQQTALRSVVLDDGPTLGVRAEPSSTSVGGGIGLYATYGDPDGMASDVQLDWAVTSPDGQSSYALDDRPVFDPLGDPERPTVAKTFVPGEVGDWTVTVTATDDHGLQAQQAQVIHVLEDQPPCIAQWQPIAAVAPAALPISAPTLFQVPLVTDDLDPYPATSSLGAAHFAWSIRLPGQPAFQPLTGATGNSMAIDPSAYRPGDVVELRVEVTDRAHTVACAADQPTCSIANNTCIQRQTWRAEAR